MRITGARKKIRIGDLLVEAGAITSEQLQEALAKQKEEGGMLGNIIMELGFISRELSTRISGPVTRGSLCFIIQYNFNYA